MDRRAFVRTGGRLVASHSLLGLPLLPDALTRVHAAAHIAGNRSPAAVAEDEAYWKPIQQAFDVNRDFVNLVTVVSGRAPAVVRDSIVRVDDRINSYKTYTGLPSSAPPPRDVARERIAKFISASAAEVALTRNTTEGVHTVVMNLPLARGDEILTSTQEHGPFYGMLADRRRACSRARADRRQGDGRGLLCRRLCRVVIRAAGDSDHAERTAGDDRTVHRCHERTSLGRANRLKRPSFRHATTDATLNTRFCESLRFEPARCVN